MKNNLDGFENIPDDLLDNVEVKDIPIDNSSDNFNVNDSDSADIDIDENGNEIDDDEDIKAGELLSGEFITDIMDMVIPSLIILSIHFIGYQIKKDVLSLTAKDKKVLAKATDKALAAIKIDFNNPFINLSIVIIAVYGSKIASAIPEMEKINKKAIEEKKKDEADIKELAQPTKEQLFNDDFIKMANEVVKQGRRKTISAAKKMLLKENLDAVNELREKHDLFPIQVNGEENFSL